ncbi:hypothetical protein T459_19509 [Capsicum annuum]|uniref:Uncharacterized protein n=1 Tax=Capsicum annuum TaxID=4072 RepID=A0A2G2Z1T6_CAPAN|nr:hypothetical protein T459_19509 [Capsicum annuum]
MMRPPPGPPPQSMMHPPPGTSSGPPSMMPPGTISQALSSTSVFNKWQLIVSVAGLRFVTVAYGAASGKYLQYELGGPRISVQTAYGVEVEVANNPYDSSLMIFIDYRDNVRYNAQSG